MKKVLFGLIFSSIFFFLIQIFDVNTAEAQSCTGSWSCRLYTTQCTGPCQDPTDPVCGCTQVCPPNSTTMLCPASQSLCTAAKSNPACCSVPANDNCAWTLPACGSHNCFTGPCESGNGCDCWGICSGSTCRHTSQVIPSCGTIPPTATPTTGPSCTYGSCSSPGAVTGSSDPNGYYSCNGTCWNWVNCPAGQTFNGTTCEGVGGGVPTNTPAPSATPTPGGGACPPDSPMQCGSPPAGACWPSCCTCPVGFGSCDSCPPVPEPCAPNGSPPTSGGCCSGVESGGVCIANPCTGCAFWNGSACQGNNLLCGSGQTCNAGTGTCDALTYSVLVRIFIDTDEDGIRDAGESNYSGVVSVNLSPGTWQNTNSSAEYTYTGVPWGSSRTASYTVPNGYTNTEPTSETFNNITGNRTANFGIIAIPVDCPYGLIADQSTVNPGSLVNLSLSGCTGVEDPPDVSAPPPFDWDPPQDDNPGDEGDPQCSDGVDNDGDGLIDTNDPRCHWDGDATNPGSYNPNDDNESPADTPARQCADGVDNDGDGFTDSADPACHTDGDADNPGSYDPNHDNESDRISSGESGSTTCSDAELSVVSGNSTSSNAQWTAHSCPAFQQVCTVTATANGSGGNSDTNNVNITVRPAGTINVDIRDVSDGSPCNSSAPLLTDETTIGLSGAVTTTEAVTDGTYSFTCLPNGSYDVSIGLPAGYQMSTGNTVQSTTITDANKTRNITFCVVNFNPWFQTTTGDVRMRGIVNPIPLGLVGSTDSSNPSVFFSTQSNASIETGGSFSAKNWLVNREYAYNSLTRNRNGVVAYSFYKNRARQEGIPIIELGAGDMSDINGQIIENGVYEVNGDLAIDSYSQIPERVALLVNGNVTISSEISIPEGQLFILAASGNITVSSSVGHELANFSSTDSNIEGIYSAQGDIVLEGTECAGGVPDRRLNVGGALIANAQKPFASDGGGIVQNERSLCLNDDNYPSLYVSTRADFLTKLTDFYKASYTKWREVDR